MAAAQLARGAIELPIRKKRRGGQYTAKPISESSRVVPRDRDPRVRRFMVCQRSRNHPKVSVGRSNRRTGEAVDAPPCGGGAGLRHVRACGARWLFVEGPLPLLEQPKLALGEHPHRLVEEPSILISIALRTKLGLRA
jgi:hypothetical protein